MRPALCHSNSTSPVSMSTSCTTDWSTRPSGRLTASHAFSSAVPCGVIVNSCESAWKPLPIRTRLMVR